MLKMLMDAVRELFGKKPEPAPQPAAEPETALQSPAPVQKAAPAPWQSDMRLQEEGPGEPAVYPGCQRSTTRVRWVSRQLDESGQPLSVREPRPETRSMSREDFTAAGMGYKSLHQLTSKWHEDGDLLWCEDVYGRRVLYDAEPFPTFDFSDDLYEDRYYRWFFLFEDGKLTRIQSTDSVDTVTVTEDAADIENAWWKTLRQLECFR